LCDVGTVVFTNRFETVKFFRIVFAVFERPFVKRFALYYRTIVLSVRPVGRWCIVAKRLDYQNETWHGGLEVGLGPGHIVLMETQLPPERGTAPQFSAHDYCGQMARWIKMPLGTEVGLGAGDIVLDGDPAPPKRVSQLPHTNFRPMSVVAKFLDGSGYYLVWR